MAEELKIKLTAEVKDFKQNTEDAKTSMQETQEEAEETENRFQRFARQMGQVSPTFKKITDKWKDQQEKVGEVFGKNSKMAKLFKATGVAAVAAIGVAVAAAVVKALEPAWRMAKETARMYDPQAYSKSAGAVEKATKRMKTAIGSFTSPIVNAVQNAFAKIIDGITWVIEKLRIGVAYITGILQAVFDPVVKGIRSVVTWVQGAINALGVFIGIGEVFKEASKDAEDAADTMGEVVEATSAGLASFDKLTTLDFGGMGDAKEAEKISESISKAKADGKDLINGINRWLDNLDLGKVWRDFVKSCGDAKDKVVKKLTDWFSDASLWASEMWGKFATACEDVKNKIVETITGWFTGASEWAGNVWQAFTDGCGNIKETISQKVGSWFDDAGTWASGVWSAFVSGCSNIRNSIVSTIAGWFSGASEWSTNMWNKVVSGCGSITGSIASKVSSWFSGASEVASGMWRSFADGCGSIKSTITSKIGSWFSGASELAGRFWQTFVDKISGIKTRMENGFRGARSSIPQLFTDLWNEVVGSFVNNFTNPIISKFQGIVDKLKGMLPSFLTGGSGSNSYSGSSSGGSGGGLSGVVNTISNAATNAWNGFKGLFGLANGGAVAPNSPAPYIIGDNKKEYEVISPVSLMEKAVMNALSKSGMGGSGGSSSSSQSINITVELDGKKIARAVYDPLETERKRRGVRA